MFEQVIKPPVAYHCFCHSHDLTTFTAQEVTPLHTSNLYWLMNRELSENDMCDRGTASDY